LKAKGLSACQIEVAPPFQESAVRRLAAAVEEAYGVPARVEALPPGSLVPEQLLTAMPDVLKPRGLFTGDEDWDRALRYY